MSITSISGDQHIISATCSTDLTGYTHHFVKPVGSNIYGDWEVAVEADDNGIIGILMKEATGSSGDVNISVLRKGGGKIKAGGTLSMGDRIRPDANSEGVAGSASANYVAIAEEDGVAGDLVLCRLESFKVADPI